MRGNLMYFSPGIVFLLSLIGVAPLKKPANQINLASFFFTVTIPQDCSNISYLEEHNYSTVRYLEINMCAQVQLNCIPVW